ncbi:MAG TPA: hypothetical protein VNA69_16835 [Thermoanaerobaculia bacterium]|nr:hypothetical protein [Thermoanaerobaculia bacterium]
MTRWIVPPSLTSIAPSFATAMPEKRVPPVRESSTAAGFDPDVRKASPRSNTNADAAASRRSRAAGSLSRQNFSLLVPCGSECDACSTRAPEQNGQP